MKSFVWLFESFLAAHKQKTPKTIFNGQDLAVAKALVEVMPNAHHGLCVWHIMRNAIRHLENMMKNSSSIVKDFEETWYDLLNKHDGNSWLESIFKIKEKKII